MFGNGSGIGNGVGFLIIMGIFGIVVAFFGAIYFLYYLFTHLAWV